MGKILIFDVIMSQIFDTKVKMFVFEFKMCWFRVKFWFFPPNQNL